MDKKNCIMCKHWEFDSGEPDYSEWTPGENWSMHCKKSVWDTYGSGYISQSEFRKFLLTANKCDKYQEAEI
jgi:hypothetical protein